MLLRTHGTGRAALRPGRGHVEVTLPLAASAAPPRPSPRPEAQPRPSRLKVKSRWGACACAPLAAREDTRRPCLGAAGPETLDDARSCPVKVHGLQRKATVGAGTSWTGRARESGQGAPAPRPPGQSGRNHAHAGRDPGSRDACTPQAQLPAPVYFCPQNACTPGNTCTPGNDCTPGLQLPAPRDRHVCSRTHSRWAGLTPFTEGGGVGVPARAHSDSAGRDSYEIRAQTREHLTHLP